MRLCTAKDSYLISKFLNSKECIGSELLKNEFIKEESYFRNLIFENEIICLIEEKEDSVNYIIIKNDDFNNYEKYYEILFTTLDSDFIINSLYTFNRLLGKECKELRARLVLNNMLIINEIKKIFEIICEFSIDTENTYYEFRLEV